MPSPSLPPVPAHIAKFPGDLQHPDRRRLFDHERSAGNDLFSPSHFASDWPLEVLAFLAQGLLWAAAGYLFGVLS